MESKGNKEKGFDPGVILNPAKLMPER